MDETKLKSKINSDNNIYLLPGKDLNVQTLKERLDIMKIKYKTNDKKQHLVNLYNKALEEEKNKNMIINLLSKDQKNAIYKEQYAKVRKKQDIEKVDPLENKSMKELITNSNENLKPYSNDTNKKIQCQMKKEI